MRWVEKTLRNDGVEHAYSYAVDGRTLRLKSALGEKTANLPPGMSEEGLAHLVMCEILRAGAKGPE